MSKKITNNLKVHGESTTQKYTDAQYNTDTQRINGAQPGTPISSKLMNTGLRNATLVTSALIEALKTVVPNDNDLTTAITVGTDTTHTALVTALTEALVKIKVETAILADNVKSGAIVEETTTARESKQGYGISLGLNSKLQFKTTWLGTHKNNDVLYYGVAGTLEGFYIVKGLSAETTSQTAGTLTITPGQTPTTHATNLQRLTFETDLGSNVNYSKTDTVNNSSTLNQIPSAKAVFNVVNTKVDKVVNYGLSKNDFTDTLKNKLDGIAKGAEVNVQSDWNQTDTTKDDFIKNKPVITKTYNAIVIPSGDYFGSNSNVRIALLDRLTELGITYANVLTVTFSVIESNGTKSLGSFTFSNTAGLQYILGSGSICIPTCKKDFSAVSVVRISNGIVLSDNLENGTGIAISFTYTK